MKDVDRSMPHLIGQALLTLLLGAMAVIAFFPFLYMVLLSFTKSDSLRFKLSDIALNFNNYQDVFTRINFLTPLKNSVIVAVVTCLLNCVLCAMAAYGIEKKRFTGSKAVFAIYLATLAVPGQVTMIPVFLMMKDLGLMNSYIALILPSCDAFGVFLIKQFIYFGNFALAVGIMLSARVFVLALPFALALFHAECRAQENENPNTFYMQKQPLAKRNG